MAQYLDDKRVFVAGATGLAGYTILQHILDSCPSVRIRGTCYQNTRPCVEDARIEYVAADLRHLDDCRRAVRGCDCAIMAAACTGGAWQLKNEPWRQDETDAQNPSPSLSGKRVGRTPRAIRRATTGPCATRFAWPRILATRPIFVRAFCRRLRRDWSGATSLMSSLLGTRECRHSVAAPAGRGW